MNAASFVRTIFLCWLFYLFGDWRGYERRKREEEIARRGRVDEDSAPQAEQGEGGKG